MKSKQAKYKDKEKCTLDQAITILDNVGLHKDDLADRLIILDGYWWVKMDSRDNIKYENTIERTYRRIDWMLDLKEGLDKFNATVDEVINENEEDEDEETIYPRGVQAPGQEIKEET